jgi:hypothetical protein
LKEIAKLNALAAEAKEFFAQEAAAQRARDEAMAADAAFLAESGIKAEIKTKKAGVSHANA